jgi:hypothetical protein
MDYTLMKFLRQKIVIQTKAICLFIFISDYFWYCQLYCFCGIGRKEQKEMVEKVLKSQLLSLFQWARSCCQRTEPTHQHHLTQLTVKKWLTSLFGFGLTHAPNKTYRLDRKYTVVGKFRGKAATIYNERFGTMAGVPRWIAID